MKRLCVLFYLLLTVGLMTGLAQDKGPSISFENATMNVGKVAEGEVIDHVFKFTNKGSATLEILSVEPSCGCTVPTIPSTKVAPGGGGSIEVKINTVGLTGNELNKTITVNTNDPRQPKVVLTVKGELVPEFELSEPSIYFGSVPSGRETSKEIVITITPDKSLSLISASSTDENVTVKMEPVPGSNGKKFRLIATQKAATAIGYHFGNIVIKTTSTAKPELKISVRGMVTKGAPR